MRGASGSFGRPQKDPNRRSVANTVVAVEAMVLKVEKAGGDGRRQKP